MATIKEVSEQITINAGKEFDFAFNQRVKDLIKIGIEKYLKQSIVKYGIDDFALSEMTVELEKIARYTDCTNSSDCFILRSKNKVLTPVKGVGTSPFTIVQTVKGRTIGYAKWQQVKHTLKTGRYTATAIYYEYVGGYIKVYNNTQLRKIKVTGVYNTVLPPIEEQCNQVSNCMQEDYEIPLQAHYIEAIKVDIYRELGISVGTQSPEVPITEDVIPPQQAIKQPR